METSSRTCPVIQQSSTRCHSIKTAFLFLAVSNIPLHTVHNSCCVKACVHSVLFRGCFCHKNNMAGKLGVFFHPVNCIFVGIVKSCRPLSVSGVLGRHSGGTLIYCAQHWTIPRCTCRMTPSLTCVDLQHRGLGHWGNDSAHTVSDGWPLTWVNHLLQVSNLGQLSFHPFKVDKLVSSNRMSATSFGVVPSGECLWGEGLVWLIGAVVCLLAAAAGPMSVSVGIDRIAPQHHWLLPINCHFQDGEAHCSGPTV